MPEVLFHLHGIKASPLFAFSLCRKAERNISHRKRFRTDRKDFRSETFHRGPLGELCHNVHAQMFAIRRNNIGFDCSLLV